jgi:group I intron endonuclease
MYTVYCITNNITNKKYIGYTNDPETRWYKHQFHGKRGDGSCTQLYRSMKKHGIENFTFEIIENNITDESLAKTREIFFIQEFNTFKSGYNATLGGTGGDMSGYDSWKESMNVYHKNKSVDSYATYGMLGKTHSKEAIEKQSIARKKHWDSLSHEQLISRSKKLSGNNNGMFGKTPKNSVRILYNGVEYNSIASASKSTGHSAKFLKKHGELYNEYSNS